MFDRLYDVWIQIKTGLSNLINFFPVVWRFRSFDYTYTLIVLTRCLKQMKDAQENHSYHLEAPRCAKQIGICINILERVVKDEYNGTILGDDRDFFGQGIVSLVESLSNRTDRDRRLDRIRYEAQAKQKKAELELFGKIFTKNVESWWS